MKGVRIEGDHLVIGANMKDLLFGNFYEPEEYPIRIPLAPGEHRPAEPRPGSRRRRKVSRR